MCCVLTRDWNFVAQVLLPVFLFFNPCRFIQIMYFYIIFNSQTEVRQFQAIPRNVPIRHVWSIVPNSLRNELLLTHPFNEFFIPVSPTRCIAAKMFDHIGNSWDVISNTHSFLLWPAIGVLYVYIATDTCACQSLRPKSPIRLLLTPQYFPTFRVKISVWIIANPCFDFTRETKLLHIPYC